MLSIFGVGSRPKPKAKSKVSTKAAAKRKPAARRPAAPRGAAPDPGRSQIRRDLIALTVLAVAVYLGFVLYAGWDGALLGDGLATGLTHLLGKVAYVVPIALALWSLAEVMTPLMNRERAINIGGLLLLAGLLLAFAAETFGIGAGDTPRRDFFESDFYSRHGGLVGEALYWGAASLLQRIGAHVLAILLVVSGLLLISGSTISELLADSRERVKRAGEGARGALARSTDPLNTAEWDADGDAIAVTRSGVTRVMPVDEMIDEEATLGGLALDDNASIETDWDVEFEELSDGPEVEPPGSNQFAYEDDDTEPTPLIPVAPVDPDDKAASTPMGKRRSGVTESEERPYTLPPAKVLEKSKAATAVDTEDHDRVAAALLEALRHFGVEARLVGMVTGPHVSRYELQLAPGTKVGKITGLKDDLAYALASTDIRILAPIPGKKAVGVEVPNQRRRLVRLGDIYDGKPKGASPLTVWLGEDVSGHAAWTDLALMPHALVAGTTGSGKSGCINAMLCSILMHASPNEVRLVLVDPKQVELNHYERLPHLLTPVVTNPRRAANVLQNLIVEMESRYGVMSAARARNLVELNKVRRAEGQAPLPQILCVIDELADLMMVAPSEVEDSIIRLAQKSRAVGIHLVLATQRPSTDIITGTIKVNIPARIAFAVASQIDSRVILDTGGAESLLGQGDMLFRPIGTSKLGRVQGAFITEEEIARIADHWSDQGEPEFDEELMADNSDESSDNRDDEFSPDEDDLLEEAARIVIESQTASVSGIQRRLRVGYTRAGRLIDMLERRNIISGYEGSKPRQVLVSVSELPRVLDWLGGRAELPLPDAMNETATVEHESATADQDAIV